MLSTWILFLLIWFGFTWSSLSFQSRDNAKYIQISVPTFKQNCTSKKMYCVNDCSFLCIEDNIKCVGGVCQLDPSNEPCDTKTGGVLMMVEEPVPHWSCICTNSAFYQGTNCNELNTDVCENGAFIFTDVQNYYCFCDEPFVRFFLNGKPHCTEKEIQNFFT